MKSVMDRAQAIRASRAVQLAKALRKSAGPGPIKSVLTPLSASGKFKQPK